MQNRAYQLALLSRKKTILRKKKQFVYFVHVLDEKGYPTGKYETKFDKEFEPLENTNGDKWHYVNLYGEPVEDNSKPSKDGNVVVGLCTMQYLILDVDERFEADVRDFAENYAKFQRLGSSLVGKTSNSTQRDLYGNVLGNYVIVFGLPISWEEISWHLKEARRLGMIKKVNAVFARFGYITSRTNAKNKDIPPPKIVKFFANGSMLGIKDYVSFWNLTKDTGFLNH